jgi:hypothetical protein
MKKEDNEVSVQVTSKDRSGVPGEYLFFACAVVLFGLSFANPLFFLGSIIFVWLSVASHLKKTGVGFLGRNFFAALAAFATSFLIVLVSPDATDGTAARTASAARETTEYRRCVDKGVMYFAEIGSYPYLTQAPNRGRRAEDVAAERCERSTKAF